MDFASVTLYLILYYIRPQEWIGWAASIQIIKVSTAFALIALFARERGVKVRDFFQTPHDWLILFYFTWIVFNAVSPNDTFGKVNANLVFYALVVQALSSIQRIGKFLNWWTVGILAIAALGVASEFGFDPMYGHDKTHGLMKGRLILNTSIFWNPNAYGHAVVPVIAMVYFVFCWKRPIFMKIAMIPIVALPLYCIYLTASKGAFLSSFAAAVTAAVFGRPKVIQGLLIGAAATIGIAALFMLPRMGELDKTSSDGAIQGRKAAFAYGLRVLKSDINGVGHGEFIRSFNRNHTFSKASHSSYVNVGTELGYPGFFLYLGLMYVCLRTLLQAKTRTIEEERIRRMLFTMLVAYMVSSWMVDFAHRGFFFLLVATVAAFHRLLLPQAEPSPETEESEPITSPLLPAPAAAISAPFPAPQSPIPVFAQTTVVTALPIDSSGRVVEPPEPAQTEMPAGIMWRKLGWIDLGLMLLMTYVFVRVWAYVIQRV